MAGPQRGRADQPAGLDQAQRGRQRDLDPLRAARARRHRDQIDREKIESASVRTEHAEPGLDHRLPGETGMLDGAPDQGQA